MYIADSIPSDCNIFRQKLVDSENVLHFIRGQYGCKYYGADDVYFKWLYIDPPCDWFHRQSSEGDLPANAAINDSGEIIALHMFIPFDAITPWGGSTGVFDEEWINGSNIRGLGRRLASHLASDVDVYCGYGCNDLSERAFRQMGFSFHEELPRLVAIFRSDKLLQMVARAGHINEAVGVDWVDSDIPSTQYFRLNSASEICKPMVARYNATLTYGVRRSIDWLIWRYDKHPHFQYHVISATADGESGVAIVRIETVADSDECIARIVDLIALPGHESETIAAALAFSSEQGCVIADLMTTDWSLADYLERRFTQLGCHLHRNTRVPYMFQPLNYGTRNNVNMAIQSRLPSDLRTFRAFKADGTQDILRTTESAAILAKR